MDDLRLMRRALTLAERGLYTAAPNPRVGCVIARDGQCVGEGWHRRTGEAHAETQALQHAGKLAQGASVYVTLEPCAHEQRTPPCCNALIAAGVSRVVVASEDSNPQVAGQGLQALRAAGIEVQCGLLSEQARALNAGFFSRFERGRPWVRVKLASSLDGRIALRSGASQWISNEKSRRDVQFWRARSNAVLSSAATVCTDNPQLNVRLSADDLDIGDMPVPQPLKVIVDSHLKTPPDAQVYADNNSVVVCCAGHDANAHENRGNKMWVMPTDENAKVSLPALMTRLAEEQINEVQVEAGSRMFALLLQHHLCDELLLYMAPCLLGDQAQALVRLGRLDNLAQAQRLVFNQVRQLDDDLVLHCSLNDHPQSRSQTWHAAGG